jgi:hypothetical protein
VAYSVVKESKNPRQSSGAFIFSQALSESGEIICQCHFAAKTKEASKRMLFKWLMSGQLGLIGKCRHYCWRTNGN